MNTNFYLNENSIQIIEKNLEHTIKSVLAQNYKDFEYIIFFDGCKNSEIFILKRLLID